MKSEIIATDISMPVSEEFRKLLSESGFMLVPSESSNRSHLIPMFFFFSSASLNHGITMKLLEFNSVEGKFMLLQI